MSPQTKLTKPLLALFLLSLLIRGGVAFLQPHPLNLDEAYHTVNAITLAEGGGLTENFIWNYLNPPETVTHPGNLYWMPLTGVIAAAGMIPGGISYSAGQLGFVLLSALLPPLTYLIAWQITRKSRLAWLAALLMLFSGFYFPVWTVIDTYTPFALFGAVSLYAAWRMLETERLGWAFVAGLSAGLAHLTRADGVLLLITIVTWCVVRGAYSGNSRTTLPKLALLVSIVIMAYFVVMLPWFIRNMQVVGSPLALGGSKTIWLQNYNDFFSYTKDISLQSYLAWGWRNILQSKARAAWINLQTLVAVLGLIVAFPLAIVGWLQRRKHPLFQLTLLYLALLFIAMTLIFTFPGPRGALFHSGGAVLSLFFTAAVIGLDTSIAFIAQRRRGWNVRAAQGIFGGALVFFALFISLFVLMQKQGNRNNALDSAYPQIAHRLVEKPGAVIANNPPLYLYYGGEQSIAIPNESVENTLKLADRYGATYLILDINHPAPLAPLFEGRVSHPRLTLEATYQGPIYLYQITE